MCAALVRGPERYGSLVELALEAVGNIEQRLAVVDLNAGGEHGGTVVLASLRGDRLDVERPGAFSAGACALQLLVQLAPLALVRGGHLGRVARLAAQCTRDLIEQAVVLAQQLDRSGAGERLDAPDVGCAGGLAEDPHGADLGGRAHVRAAAQLA